MYPICKLSLSLLPFLSVSCPGSFRSVNATPVLTQSNHVPYHYVFNVSPRTPSVCVFPSIPPRRSHIITLIRIIDRCNCHCSSSSVDNQENLADVTQYFMQRSFEESLSHSGRMSAARRALQKTAATQTATATADNTTCTSVTPTSSRTPEVPPDYLTLSPRTAQASASSSRKSSRRRNASRDSSSRKAYTSIDSDTDER